MATRSTIAIQLGEDEFKQIYCHWDGYLSNNGKLLLEHYNTSERVKALIALGDLSSLREELAPKEGEVHSFEKPLDNVCIAYGRDRGEEGTEARKTTMYQSDCQREEYNYVFTLENKWVVYGSKGTFRKMLNRSH